MFISGYSQLMDLPGEFIRQKVVGNNNLPSNVKGSVFFNDALNFLSFNTNAKPWPFSNKPEASDSDEEIDVVEGESVDIQSDDGQPEQTTS